jgi:hypothetical protein
MFSLLQGGNPIVERFKGGGDKTPKEPEHTAIYVP